MTDPAASYRLAELFKDLYSFLRPYRRSFIWGTLIRLVSDLVWLFPAFGFAVIVDLLVAHEPGDSIRTIWIIIATILAAIVIRYLGSSAAKRIVFSIGKNMNLDAQTQTLGHLFRLNMDWHEQENVGNKLKKIENGGDAIEDMTRVWVAMMVEILVNFVGITIIVTSADVRIGFVLLLFMLLYFPISLLLLRKASATAREVNIKEEEVHGLFFEALNNIRSVKVMGMIPELSRRVRILVRDLFVTTKKGSKSFKIETPLWAYSLTFSGPRDGY